MIIYLDFQENSNLIYIGTTVLNIPLLGKIERPFIDRKPWRVNPEWCESSGSITDSFEMEFVKSTGHIVKCIGLTRFAFLWSSNFNLLEAT